MSRAPSVPHAGSCKNARLLAPEPRTGNTMDIERINAIGSTLADLTARTDALRGYL